MDLGRAIAYSCAFLALGAIGVALALNDGSEHTFTVCFGIFAVAWFLFQDLPKKS